jgi:hypothetical protein
MPVKTHKMGPGLLSIGSAGTSLDITAQLTSALVKWKADAGDSTETLSGDTVGGDRTYTAQLTFTAYQDDLAAGGLVDYTWAHKGEEVPFTFEPQSALERGVTGVVTIDPLDIGGDVGKKNTSDASWDCVGEPALADTGL